MTCIVGYIDKKDGCTYMGGDSQATSGWMGQTIKQKKVFKIQDTPNGLIGFTGSIRDLDILTYAEKLIDKRDEPNIDHKYIVTKMIPNLTNLLSNNGRKTVDDGLNGMNSEFLFSYKDKLWRICGNYSVFEIIDEYNSTGCGQDFALGNLEATKDNEDISIVDKIHMALQAAAKYSIGVAPPFYIINSKNDEVIEFKE